MEDPIEVTWEGGFTQFGYEKKNSFANMHFDINGNVFGSGLDKDHGDYQICGTWTEQQIEFIINYFSSHQI